MVGQISTTLADANLNIIDMLNKSRGDLAYTLVDVDTDINQETLDKLSSIKGVLNVRAM
jgi:D-3-phosphoglycerate dehydrogenase